MAFFTYEECEDILNLRNRLDEKDLNGWTLSTKKRYYKDKVYTYYCVQRYDKETGKRKETLLKRSEEAEYLARFREKAEIKRRLSEYKKRFDAMKIRGKRTMLKTFEQMLLHEDYQQRAELAEAQRDLDPYTQELRVKQVSPDGTLFDSKNELAIDGFLKYLGIEATHNEELEPWNPYTCTFDFTFVHQDAKYYLECMGMMDDPVYARHQQDKLRKYEQYGITRDKNLLLVKSYNNQILMSELIWELLRLGIISQRKVRKVCRLDKPKSPYRHTFLVVNK